MPEERRGLSTPRAQRGAAHRILRNLEERHDFDVVWPRDFRALDPGITAVLRVKNEAKNLPWVLPPLFDAAERIVVVDNQSDDGTPDVALKVAEIAGAEGRLEVVSCPLDVSRCGPEHLATPEMSVHNLSYFYNWSFSHVHTAYSMKWDGDMVLTAEGVEAFAELNWMLEDVEAVVSMPRHPLYVESERVAYLDTHMINVEAYVYPMAEDYRHVKAYEWELRLIPPGTRVRKLPEGLCVELKHLDGDEFAHWDSPESFGTSGRTMRKAREWEVFHALREGRVDEVDGVVRIETPPEHEHVIGYVTGEWLPRRRRPIAVPGALRGSADPELEESESDSTD